MRRLSLMLILLLGANGAGAAELTCAQAIKEYNSKVGPAFAKAMSSFSDTLEECANAGFLLDDLKKITPQDCKELWDEFARADDFLENGDCSPF